MRTITTSLLATVVLMLAVQGVSQAQSGPTIVQHGMFGPRVLGSSLQPKPTPFSDGLLVSPGGKFLGIRSNWGPALLATEVILPPLTDLREIPREVELAAPLAQRAAEPQPVSPTPLAPVPVPMIPQPPMVSGAPLPVPLAPPPAEFEPVPANMQELPMRRMGSVGAGADAAPAQPPAMRQPVGPQSLSPFQTPGGAYTKFEPGFSRVARPDNRVGRQLTSQLGSSRRIRALSPIRVDVVGETATLRGTVASSYDRMVAEQVVRMEAGIWKVDNQLQVGAPATSSNR
jgi:hypothetical protein